MNDLEYRPNSLLPPGNAERMKQFEKWLGAQWERRVRLPLAYVEHVTAYHGGIPGKRCFKMPEGAVRVVGRFFNFLDEDEAPDSAGAPSRRMEWGPDRDIIYDYAVERYLTAEYWGLRLQEHDETLDLLPIAGLAPAETPRVFEPDYDFNEEEFDLLCLNYAKRGEPPVVVWQFTNMWSEPPVIQRVAPSFAAFSQTLYRC
jgi:hypothetical protein